jgi:hypothetical protein
VDEDNLRSWKDRALLILNSSRQARGAERGLARKENDTQQDASVSKDRHRSPRPSDLPQEACGPREYDMTTTGSQSFLRILTMGLQEFAKLCNALMTN